MCRSKFKLTKAQMSELRRSSKHDKQLLAKHETRIEILEAANKEAVFVLLILNRVFCFLSFS